MALHSTQDQNFNVHFDGVKINGSTVQKNRGGIGGRKALNDISNSAKLSTLQASRKHNNVILIGEDLGVSKKAQVRVGEKTQVSGRKALGDLTNSVKPIAQQQALKKRSRGKKRIAIAEDKNLPYSIAEEGFLHNHDECVKSQKKASNLDQFLKTTGLHQDLSCQSVACNPLPRKPKDENPRIFWMEEIPEEIIEDSPRQSRQNSPICFFERDNSPICWSPNSPRMLFPRMKDYEDFVLAETPRRSK